MTLAVWSRFRWVQLRRCMVACAVLILGWTMTPGAAVCWATSQATAIPQSKARQAAPAPSPYGQTIFSRSDRDSATSPEVSTAPSQHTSGEDLISDRERAALTYDSYKFEVHLDPARNSIAVHAHLLAHNSGTQSLSRIALQLSSSLHWYSVRVDGATEKFEVEAVESDIDHTGQLSEAVVPLTTPLAPGASISLDVMYSGTITLSSRRLLRLGAPPDVAETSDWDQIAPGFTALRGFGNVIWFPVSTAPVLLGEGNRMFDSIGKWKRKEMDARVQMTVLVEYEGAQPAVAFLNGVAVKPDSPPTEGSSAAATDPSSKATPSGESGGGSRNGTPRVASFRLPPTTVGFSPLSLFVIRAEARHSPGLDIYTQPGNESAAAAYQKAAEEDRPLVERWLGSHLKRPVVLVDLPKKGDLPFEQDHLLLLPLDADVSGDEAGPMLAQAMSHSYFISPRPWLDEGVARWISLLWLERRAGRATAISQMESLRPALTLAETSDPGANPGQSLIDAWSEIYYRGKAADVLWMLRDMVGDKAMSVALQGYRADADHAPDFFEGLLEKASGKDLKWFFDDWVYRDRGLPDLHIVSAYQRAIRTKNSASSNYLVSVEVQNDSFCAAEVPVTVRGGPSIQVRRLHVPSHASATLHLLLASEPDTVVVNDGSVPEVRTTTHEKPVLPAR